MEDAQKQLVDKLKSASNILVTVSRDPSVDQLAALIGLTLLLTKDDKHAAAVFSGKVPSTIEFLKPDETIEKNTDSLRDFIIALDKNKADKLRYKVEDNVVRIFITPYKTSISQEDFEFSQGDFNVDLVVALGVQKQEDLDEAIVAHGQILHDATVASVNVEASGGLGTINWHQPGASSLSELVTRIGQAIDAKLFDEQISTALMTGIVAETDRFSNEKTSPDTMSASAVLMTAGANQQLVASKLMDAGQLASIKVQDTPSESSAPDSINETPSLPAAPTPQTNDGALEIEHQDKKPLEVEVPVAETSTPPADDLPVFELPKPTIESLPSEAGMPDSTQATAPSESETVLTPGAKLMTEPPTIAPPTELTPYTGEDDTAPANPYGLPTEEPAQLLQHDSAPAPPPPALSIPDTPPAANASYVPPVQVTDTTSTTSAPPLPPADPTVIAPDPTQPTDEVHTHQTLTELEEAVASPHIQSPNEQPQPGPGTTPEAGVGTARDEVSKALNDINASEAPQPAQSLNSVQLGQELHPSDLPSDPTLPSDLPPADADKTDDTNDPNSPPPVPPPIPFQFGNPPPPQ